MTTNHKVATIFNPLAVTKELVGKKCLRAAFAYGGELHLHCGILTKSKSPNGSGRGSWRLGTCGTQWKLITPKGMITSKAKDEIRLKKYTSQLVGTHIARFEIAGKNLVIGFDNGSQLMICPTLQDEQYDLPYWELFMPQHRLVKFGPQNRWSVGRSDF